MRNDAKTFLIKTNKQLEYVYMYKSYMQVNGYFLAYLILLQCHSEVEIIFSVI